MNLFHISIVGNIILLIITAFLALDRVYFRKNCELRHNPIDMAIKEIKQSLADLRESMDSKLQRIWEAIDKLK